MVTSDHDASLTVPGAQKVDTVSGSEKPVSQVEPNAVTLGKLFQLRFADCTLGEKATEELVSRTTGYSVSYEMERGCAWAVQFPCRVCAWVAPRASVFSPDSSSSYF